LRFKRLYDKKALELLDIDVIDGEIITVQQKLELKKNTLEQSIETVIKEVTAIDPTTRRNYRRKISNRCAFRFLCNEKHSFQEWLKLSEHNLSIEETKKTQYQNEGKKKNALIDKFIENSPISS
jgi:hypothetical protein